MVCTFGFDTKERGGRREGASNPSCLIVQKKDRVNMATRWRKKGILFSVEKSEKDALKSPLVGKIGKILNIQGNRLSVVGWQFVWAVARAEEEEGENDEQVGRGR